MNELEAVAERLGGICSAIGGKVLPMTKRELRAFEKKLGVSLPATYRDFLQKYGAARFGHSVLYRPVEKLRGSSETGVFSCFYGPARKAYPETLTLREITGVGPVTALAYVLTLEDPTRFNKSRDVGPYLGLTPKRDQSGKTDKALSISKAGNTYLRRLLVGSAHYILGPFGPDCDLRRYGTRIASRGGKAAKRKAVVAVARKLAVLMHQLWKNKATYDPFYKNCLKAAA